MKIRRQMTTEFYDGPYPEPDEALSRMHKEAERISAGGSVVVAGGLLYFEGVAVALLFDTHRDKEVSGLLGFLAQRAGLVHLRKEDFQCQTSSER